MQAKRYHERIANDPLPRIITTNTNDRIPYFSIPSLAKLAYDRLVSVAAFHGIGLCTFAIMPDHVHIVATNLNVKNVSDFMHSYKRSISREIGRWHDNEHGRSVKCPSVWQSSFNQLLIYGKESFEHRIKYVANNAVKHGIVKDRNEYPWTYVAPEFAYIVSS